MVEELLIFVFLALVDCLRQLGNMYSYAFSSVERIHKDKILTIPYHGLF